LEKIIYKLNLIECRYRQQESYEQGRARI